MNVLLVEDEKRIADFVTQGFAAAGHQISHAVDGGQALEQIERGGHDILILDLMLPIKDGIEVLRDVRAKGRAMPVLILSAKVELEDRLRGFEFGADDYVPKPFYIQELSGACPAGSCCGHTEIASRSHPAHAECSAGVSHRAHYAAGSANALTSARAGAKPLRRPAGSCRANRSKPEKLKPSAAFPWLGPVRRCRAGAASAPHRQRRAARGSD